MRTLPIFRAIVVTGLLTLCVGMSPQALGQEQGQVLDPNAPRNTGNNQVAPASAAPQPSPSKAYPTWVGYLAIALMVAAIMGISLIPSKRSHQD